MVNFGPVGTVPEKFKDRKFYQHNPTVTLMRTTVEENRKLGEEIGRKAAAATGPTCIMILLKGVSAIDQADKAFADPNARQALYDGILATHGSVELIDLDNHINDVAFAEATARRLLELIGNCGIDAESRMPRFWSLRKGIVFGSGGDSQCRIVHKTNQALVVRER